MEGLRMVCEGCRVMAKDDFSGTSGRVYQLNVAGFGFSHTFRTGDPAEAEKWPSVGTMVDVQAPLTSGRDGQYKIGAPELVPVAAAGAARTPKLASA
jgi:hypothetical protein